MIYILATIYLVKMYIYIICIVLATCGIKLLALWNKVIIISFRAPYFQQW